MITEDFVELVSKEYQAYSLLFVSWVFFYYYGLRNDSNFNLFYHYSKSSYKNSKDQILSDLSNFEKNEKLIFPWNLNPDEQPLWFPNFFETSMLRDKLIKHWRSFLNTWVQVCFNNGQYIIIKSNETIAIKILSNNLKQRKLIAFGLLENLQCNSHISKYSSYLELHEPFFVYGPMSILEYQNNSENEIEIMHHSQKIYAWKIDIYYINDYCNVFFTQTLEDYNEIDYYENKYRAVTFNQRTIKMKKKNDILYNIK